MVLYSQMVSRGTDTRFGSRTSGNELTHWCIDICSSVIGLFTLFFFLAMGGIFALVGPWLILVVIHLVRQKQVKKAVEHVRGYVESLEKRGEEGYIQYMGPVSGSARKHG